MRHRALARALAVGVILVVAGVFAVAYASAGGGHSDAAKKCQKGAWRNWVRSDGTPFRNAGECVSYVAQGSALLPEPWPMYRATPSHQGWNPNETILSPTSVSGLTVNWSYTTGDRILSSPAVANGVVYIGSDDGKVYALDAGSGAVDWSYDTGVPLYSSSPAVVNGIVYIGTADGKVDALDAGSGALDWSYDTGDSTRSMTSPTVANGVVYVGSWASATSAGSGTVYALDAGSGALEWSSTPPDQYLTTSPAVANGVVYVGTGIQTDPPYGPGNGSVYALDASSGDVVWSYHVGDICPSSPTVANGIVYAGCDNGTMYALDAGTGALDWSYTTGSEASGAAVANGVVYFGSLDGMVYARDASNGNPDWSYSTGGLVFSMPAVANGVVYIGSFDHNVYALDAGSGAVDWSYTTGDSIYSSPAVANGAVYIGSYDDKVYAFGLSG